MVDKKRYPEDYPGGITVTLGDGDGISIDEDGYVHSFGVLDLKPLSVFTVRVDENGYVRGFGTNQVLTNDVVTVDKLTIDGRPVTIAAGTPADAGTEVDSPMTRIRTLIEQHPSVFGKLDGACPYQRAVEFLESMVK